MIDALGITSYESKISAPAHSYACGQVILCFVPRISEIKMAGKKMRSIGFLIALRRVDQKEWLFLDGTGLRRNPGMLKLLLPDLPEDTPIPENRSEVIKEE